MTVWTIQPLILYEKLMERETLLCDPKQEGFWGLISEEFQAAYDWLAEQMCIRLAISPQDARYPFWAWALIDGVSKKPDLRRTEFNNYVDENVILELEIPDDMVQLHQEETAARKRELKVQNAEPLHLALSHFQILNNRNQPLCNAA